MWGCVSNCCLWNGSVCFGSVRPHETNAFMAKSWLLWIAEEERCPRLTTAPLEKWSSLSSCKKVVLIKMTDCSTPARVNTKVNCTILHCKFSLSGSRWNWTPQRQWTTEQNTVINVTSGEAKLFVHHEWWLLQLSTHTNWHTESVLHWNQRSFKSFGCIIWRNGWHHGHLSNKLKGFSLSLFRFGNQHFSAGRTAASGTSNC